MAFWMLSACSVSVARCVTICETVNVRPSIYKCPVIVQQLRGLCLAATQRFATPRTAEIGQGFIPSSCSHTPTYLTADIATYLS